VPAGSIISQSPAAGEVVPALSPVALVVSLGSTRVLVPAVLGQSSTEARATLEGAGLIVNTGVVSEHSESVAAGLAIRSEPEAGTTVPRGTRVALVVSLGAPNVLVPSIAGATRTDAETLITNAGLQVGTVTEQTSETVAAGLVISQ